MSFNSLFQGHNVLKYNKVSHIQGYGGHERLLYFWNI